MNDTTNPPDAFRLMLARAKVLAKAAPTHLATLIAVLVALNTYVVPELPIEWQAQVAAGVLSVIGAIGAVIRVVSVLTAAHPDTHGLDPAPGYTHTKA